VDFRDVAKARNHGAGICGKPDYYLFVDADNWLPTDYLSKLIGGMDRQTTGVTYCHLDTYDDNGRRTGRSPAVKPFRIEDLRRQNLADTCSLVRRQAFDQVGGWKSNPWGLHDWDLWLRITVAGWGMKLVPDVALCYRVHKGAMSDERRGKHECGSYVMSQSTLTTLVTLFSGRGWHLDRYFDCLGRLDWPHENMHLVAVDNSRDEPFHIKLKHKLEKCGVRYTYLQDDSRVVETMPAAKLSDSAKGRTDNNYALNIHLARLYALAGRYLPASTAYVWSVEDDVEYPANALQTLATELFQLQDAGAVSAVLRGRFNSNLIAWLNGKPVGEPPTKSVQIDASGFYCMLLRRATWERIAWRPGATLTDQWPYYDWGACHDIIAAGERVYLAPVRCRHWQADGSVVDV